jgi:hypothetical protein
MGVGRKSYNPDTLEGMSQHLDNTVQGSYLPDVQTYTQGMAPIEQARLGASAAVTPGYNDLAMAELERNQQRASAIQGAYDAGQTQADTANLNAYGGDYARAVRGVDEAGNKEYYDTLKGLSSGYNRLLSEASPNLSGGQRAEMERGIARMNPGSTDNSGLDTAGKAMQFGDAHQKQVANFGNILSGITAGLGALKTGNYAAGALGRDSRQSPVNGSVTTGKAVDNSALDLGQNMYNQQNAANMGRYGILAKSFKSVRDLANEDSQTLSNITSSVGKMGA